MSVRYALLGLLEQQPRHGYELRAAFEALAGGAENWSVKPAQVYSTLARLSKSGLVIEESIEQDAGPEKRIYNITDAGRAELRNWFTTPVADEHVRDEFFIKMMISLATGDQLTPLVMKVQRDALYRELHRLTTQRQEVDPRVGLAHILLLDKTVMHLEADLRWLDMVEARLSSVRSQPMPHAELRPRGRPPKKG
jgi:DNA-binding PadR family transcriptional regulator